MSETLKGNLSQLKLVDIMKILCSSQRTGKLSLQNGEEIADIYFLSGAIIHAKYNMIIGENAIYTLFAWSDGIFTFHPNISVKNKTILTPAAEILKRAEAVDGEWEEVRKIIKSEVLKLCEQLAEYKRVKDVIIMTEELPKTSTRKVKRYILLDTLQKLGEL